jgi:hypothetical protein
VCVCGISHKRHKPTKTARNPSATPENIGQHNKITKQRENRENQRKFDTSNDEIVIAWSCDAAKNDLHSSINFHELGSFYWPLSPTPANAASPWVTPRHMHTRARSIRRADDEEDDWRDRCLICPNALWARDAIVFVFAAHVIQIFYYHRTTSKTNMQIVTFKDSRLNGIIGLATSSVKMLCGCDRETLRVKKIIILFKQLKPQKKPRIKELHMNLLGRVQKTI